MARTALSKKTRFEIFKRDRFACQYCGATPPDALLEVDHITPVCDGGDNDRANLVTACFGCNRGKGGISLATVPKSLAEKAAEIAEREAQLAGYREVVQTHLDRVENDMWTVAYALVHDAKEEGVRRDWLRSIKTFNARLPLHEVVDAAEIARARFYHGSKMFRYFCGVCWNKIRAREE